MERKVTLDPADLKYRVCEELGYGRYLALEEVIEQNVPYVLKICKKRSIDAFRYSYFLAMNVAAGQMIQQIESQHLGLSETKAFLTVMHALFKAVEDMIGEPPLVSLERTRPRFTWPEDS